MVSKNDGNPLLWYRILLSFPSARIPPKSFSAASINVFWGRAAIIIIRLVVQGSNARIMLVLHQRLHAPTNAPMEQEYALEMAFNFAVIIMETDAQNGVQYKAAEEGRYAQGKGSVLMQWRGWVWSLAMLLINLMNNTIITIQEQLGSRMELMWL